MFRRWTSFGRLPGVVEDDDRRGFSLFSRAMSTRPWAWVLGIMLLFTLPMLALKGCKALENHPEKAADKFVAPDTWVATSRESKTYQCNTPFTDHGVGKYHSNRQRSTYSCTTVTRTWTTTDEVSRDSLRSMAAAAGWTLTFGEGDCAFNAGGPQPLRPCHASAVDGHYDIGLRVTQAAATAPNITVKLTVQFS